MSESTELITVIVPFFQKTPGILAKSLESATRQTVLDSHKIEIIVIDDASPLPAKLELGNFVLPDSCSLRIISQQKNGGPAVARNRGLDEAKSSTKFIAFLDSDDYWTEDHLSNAIRALSAGADFYFSDFYQLGQKISAFNRAKKISLADHKKLPMENILFRYSGDMLKQIITGNIIGTPTVVYRFISAPKLRFREDFFNAGEDYFFWIDFCSISRRIVFSSHQECECGKGVNAYSGSEWGTLALLDRILNELRYRKLSLDVSGLSADTRRIVHGKIKTLRLEFTLQALHRLTRRKTGTWSRIKKMYRIDCLTIFLLPVNAIKILFAKLKTRDEQLAK